jgi:hypothetical protein
VKLLPRLYVPNPRVPVGAAGRQQAPIGAEGQRQHVSLVVGQRSQALTGPGVPQPNRVVSAAGGHELAVGSKDRSQHPILFRFTIFWEEVIVKMPEEWVESLVIIEEGDERTFA